MSHSYRRKSNTCRVSNPNESLWTYRYNSNADPSVDNKGRMWVRVDSGNPIPVYFNAFTVVIASTAIGQSVLVTAPTTTNGVISIQAAASTPGAWLMAFSRPSGDPAPVDGDTPVYVWSAPVTGFGLNYYPSYLPLGTGPFGNLGRDCYFVFSSQMDVLAMGPIGWVNGNVQYVPA